MPTHEDIIQKITSFNNRYHVNFSLSDFDTACARSNEQLLIQSSNVSTKDQILINETDQIINNLGQKETIIIDFDSSSVTTSPFINNDENHTIKETSLDKK